MTTGLSRSAAPAGKDTRLRTLVDGARLSPAQRRIARWLLDHPEEAVFLTSADIAERVGVSQPSVTRFAFALGFTRFSELRQILRDGVLERPTEEKPDPGNGVQALVDTEIRDLQVLRDSLRELDRLHEVAGLLAASRPLPVLGVRVSHPLAGLFGYFAGKVHPDVRVLPQGGSVLEDEISRAAAAGATGLLAFGLPRYPRELRDSLVWARRSGLKVALVTDRSVSALTEHADLVLSAPVSPAFAFDSQAAPTVLTMALLHTMLDMLPSTEQQSLEDFETSAQDRQLFLPD